MPALRVLRLGDREHGAKGLCQERALVRRLWKALLGEGAVGENQMENEMFMIM